MFLLYEPNFDDALSPLCIREAEFEENVKISIYGGEIEDARCFEPNYGWLETQKELEQKSEDMKGGDEHKTDSAAIETDDAEIANISDGDKTTVTVTVSEDKIVGVSDTEKVNIAEDTVAVDYIARTVGDEHVDFIAGRNIIFSTGPDWPDICRDQMENGNDLVAENN